MFNIVCYGLQFYLALHFKWVYTFWLWYFNCVYHTCGPHLIFLQLWTLLRQIYSDFPPFRLGSDTVSETADVFEGDRLGYKWLILNRTGRVGVVYCKQYITYNREHLLDESGHAWLVSQGRRLDHLLIKVITVRHETFIELIIICILTLKCVRT